MKHKLSALLACAGLLASLTACPAGEAELTPSPDVVSPDAGGVSDGGGLPADFTADPYVEDLCLATAGIPGDFDLYTINGVPVKARAYLYWLAYAASYQSAISTNYEIDWTAAAPDGGTMSDYLKEAARSNTTNYAILPIKAHELGYEMTQEQTDELETNLALSIESVGGEEAYQERLRQLGLNEETFYSLNAAAYYYDLLLDALFSDPSDEDMEAYIQENDLLAAKHILLMTIDSATRVPLDEETIAEKKATAEDLLAQLQSSSDLAADFDALMNEYSEDTGLLYSPNGYLFTANEMVAEFEDATRGLGYGEMSGIVETAYGYHIILRLNPADMEEFRSEYPYDALDAQLFAWTDEAEVVLSDEYKALDVQLFYEKYLAYQDAFTLLSIQEESGETEGQTED